MAADGSIRIDTKINEKGMNQGVKSISESAKSLSGAVRNVNNEINGAFGAKQQAKIDQLTGRLSRQESAINKQSAAMENAKNKLYDWQKSSSAIEKQKALIDQLREKIIATADAGNGKEFDKLTQSLGKAEMKLGQYNTEFDALLAKQEQLVSASQSVNYKTSSKAQAELEKVDTKMEKLGFSIRNSESDVERLNNKLSELSSSPESNATIKKLNSDMEIATQKLHEMELKADTSGDKLQSGFENSVQDLERLKQEASLTAKQLEEVRLSPNSEKVSTRFIKNIERLTGATQRTNKEIQKTTSETGFLGRALDQFQKRIIRLGLAAFIFNNIRRALTGFRSYLSDAIRANVEFSTSLARLKGNLMTAFQPILSSVMPALNALIGALAKATSYIVAFISLLTGKSIKSSQDAAKSLHNQAKGYGAAGAAAKKAAGQLADFDELNVLSKKDEADSGGGGGGDGAVAPEFESVDLSLFDLLQEKLDNLMKLLEPVKKALEGLWEELKRLGGFVWKGLKDFYETFLKPVGSWVMGEGLPRFINALTNGLAQVDWQKINDALHKLWSALAPFTITIGEGLLWFWEKVLVPFGVWILNNALPAFFEALAAVIKGLDVNAQTLGAAFANLWENGLKPLLGWIGDRILEFFEWIKNNGQLAANLLLGIVTALIAFQAIQAIPALLAAVGTGLISLVTAIPAILVSIGVFVATLVALSDASPIVVIALSLLAGAFIAFGIALKIGMGPVGWIIGAIVGLGVAIAAIYTSLTNKALPEIQRFGEGISDVTKNMMNPVIDLADSASAKITELFLTGKPILAEDTAEIAGYFTEMADTAINDLERMKESAIDNLATMFGEEAEAYEQSLKDTNKYYDDKITEINRNDTALQNSVRDAKIQYGLESVEYASALLAYETYTNGKASEIERMNTIRAGELEDIKNSTTGQVAEYARIQESVEATYDAKIATVESSQQRINDFIAQNMTKDGTLSEEHYATLQQMQTEHYDTMIDSMVTDNAEAKSLKETRQEDAIAIQVAETSAVIEEAKRERDDTIAVANEKFDSLKATASESYDTLDTAGKASVDTILTEAERERDGTIKLAEEEFEGIIERQKTFGEDFEKGYDEAHNRFGIRFKEKWDEMKTWLDTFWKDVIDSAIKNVTKMAKDVANLLPGGKKSGSGSESIDRSPNSRSYGGSARSPYIPEADASMYIPKLATGAVIPPNSEFLAVLGDQKNGRNLEAPESLIRQIIQEELSNLEMPQPQTVLNASPDMAALIRLIFPQLEQEGRRRGTNLVIGGAST